ncbi:MAG: HIT family protein [Parachlamydia sp.]|nr:HIT family protein [Parachlamydia sp.]
MILKKFLPVILFYSTSLAGDCPFCRQELLEKQTAYENSHWRVLVDYAPRVSGHLLAIPKRHAVKAHELTAEEWSALSEVISKVVIVFQSVFQTRQYMLLEKNGRNAGQSVPHVHFHLFPFPDGEISKEARKLQFEKVYGKRPAPLAAEELKKEVEFFRACFAELIQK